MIGIKVDVDAAGVIRALAGFEKQSRYAAAVALTRTAKIAEKDVKTDMQRVFRAPTRWALGSTRVIPATKANLSSAVWLKDRHGAPASRDTAFLFPEVFGGPRGRKAFETKLLKYAGLRPNEFLVPATDFPLDAFGNMPVGVIRQILSQLGATGGGPGRGYDSNVKKGKAQSRQSRARQLKAGTFFIPPAGGPLPRGIYQRKRTGSGWDSRMVFKIVVGKPRYRTRLRLGAIAKRAVDRHFADEFAKAYQQAMATAR